MDGTANIEVSYILNSEDARCYFIIDGKSIILTSSPEDDSGHLIIAESRTNAKIVDLTDVKFITDEKTIKNNFIKRKLFNKPAEVIRIKVAFKNEEEIEIKIPSSLYETFVEELFKYNSDAEVYLKK